MTYVALAVGVVGTGYKIYDSAHKSSQAKKLAAANKRPIYKPDGTIDDTYNLALSEANDGTLQDYATRQLEQSQSGAIDAVLKSGGKLDFNTVHNQFGTQLQGALAMLARDRAQRIANVNATGYNKAKAADAAFSYNQDGPYKDTKQAEEVLHEQSAQSAADAVSAAASTAGNYGVATTRAGEYGRTTLTPPPTRVTNAGNNVISSVDTRRQGTTVDPAAGNYSNNAPGAVNPNITPGIVAPGTITGFDEWGNPIYG